MEQELHYQRNRKWKHVCSQAAQTANIKSCTEGYDGFNQGGNCNFLHQGSPKNVACINNVSRRPHPIRTELPTSTAITLQLREHLSAIRAKASQRGLQYETRNSSSQKEMDIDVMTVSTSTFNSLKREMELEASERVTEELCAKFELWKESLRKKRFK